MENKKETWQILLY